MFPEYKKSTISFTGYKSTFPFRNMMSYMLGPMRVYKAFDKFVEK